MGATCPDSAAVAETVAQEIVEIRDVVDFLNGGIDIVFHAAKADFVAVEEDITGTPIAVAGLTDGADVDEGLPVIEFMMILDFVGRVELVQIFGEALREHAGNVRVSLEAIL